MVVFMNFIGDSEVMIVVTLAFLCLIFQQTCNLRKRPTMRSREEMNELIVELLGAVTQKINKQSDFEH
jgi:hypothetical protein